MTLESATQQAIRLEGARLGLMLWRNNSGACFDDTGRLIRYGLGNDSAKINDRIKSSDLIGLQPRMITPDMVGGIFGVFVAVECKASNWLGRTLDAREQAQATFHKVVQSHGGLAGFARSPQDLHTILGI